MQQIVRISSLVLGTMVATLPAQAQTLLNNASNIVAGSDNTGDSANQPGTEVLHSTPGQGISLASGGAYEHVGQFYVAANGIWNRLTSNGQSTIGTDYFGYAPMGSSTAYLGRGIIGASKANGGKGTGQPTFSHLQLNSTGEFPVEGGMFVTHSLVFNANGPRKANRITTPNCTAADSPANAVVFAPTATIEGADHQNYIDGYASVTGASRSFELPLGDAAGYPNAFGPLTINSATVGTVTARYWHTLQHSAHAVGEGIGSVSLIGDWPISAPAGTSITINRPALGLSTADVSTLRAVGWNGSRWVDLSGGSVPISCLEASCLLTATISVHITDVAIGSTSRSVFKQGEEGESVLTIWPNPSQGKLNLAVSLGQSIRQVQALDLQGRPVGNPIKGTSSLDTSALPAGTYLLEAITTQGQSLRKSFVKQP